MNLKKFDETRSPLLRRADDTWIDGLRLLKNRSTWPRKINHPWSAIFHGYAFPDPFYFANNYDDTQDRVSKLLVVWLFVRLGWKAKLSSASNLSTESGKLTGTPTPQDWKDFLVKIGRGLNLIDEPTQQSQIQSGPPAAKKVKVRSSKETAAFEDQFKFHVDTSCWPVDLYWDGGMVRAQQAGFNAPLDVAILSEIVWELCENNWRTELLTLDRCIVRRESMSVVEQGERDEMVGRVFPGGQFMIHQMPCRDEGLGAAQWNDRMEYVEAFRELLSGWPGRAGQRLSTMVAFERDGPGQNHTASQAEVVAVEAVAYPFYCATFLQYFGRAATIPRPMP